MGYLRAACRYWYTVDHVKESEFKAYEIIRGTVVDEESTTRTRNNRHGIRIVFRQVGEIGAFDFQTTMINLVVALGLLGLATTMVDVMMVYVLPQKDVYAKAKEEEVTMTGDPSVQQRRASDVAAGGLKDELLSSG
jgi:hypothetical protein